MPKTMSQLHFWGRVHRLVKWPKKKPFIRDPWTFSRPFRQSLCSNIPGQDPRFWFPADLCPVGIGLCQCVKATCSLTWENVLLESPNLLSIGWNFLEAAHPLAAPAAPTGDFSFKQVSSLCLLGMDVPKQHSTKPNKGHNILTFL